MERLTEKVFDEWCVPCIRMQEAIDRLAAYEDTGLTPEEIIAAEDRRHNCKIECLLREYNKLCAAIGNEDGIVTPEDIEHIRTLREAEADGRLGVLPCKVGDTVYFSAWFGTAPHIVKRVVEPYFYTQDVRNMGSTADFSLRDFGKTVFLTREEAEAALAKEAER